MAVVGSSSSPRHTARGIVIKDGQILLMERWRSGSHYFSIPGGGVEPGETLEETVLREIAEETTVQIRVEQQVLQMNHDDVRHHIFLCTYLSGEPYLPEDAPEFMHHNDDNVFQPGWFDVDQLPGMPFVYWQPVKAALIDGLANGFGDQIVVVRAD